MIKKLQELYIKLAEMERFRSDKQDFGTIWIVRSEIKDLEYKASLQARYYAARAKQRENEERERREKAETEAQDTLKKMQIENAKLNVRNHFQVDAKSLIKQGSLFYCRRCVGGSIQVECSMCFGRGLGELRYKNETVTSLCSNRHPSCRICGGTGVFGNVIKKMVYDCEKCDGKGQTTASCPACDGGQIVNRQDKAVKLPRELREVVLELLRKKTY